MWLVWFKSNYRCSLGGCLIYFPQKTAEKPADFRRSFGLNLSCLAKALKTPSEKGFAPSRLCAKPF